MSQVDYTVRLDSFEGPLDLLLFLIRRAEVEVTDIPIAVITEQYLKYLEQFTVGSELEGPAGEGPAATVGQGGGAGAMIRPGERRRPIDIERAGEFLVMAATLMEIKSRMLAPPAETARAIAGEDDSSRGAKKETDPRAELVRQLIEYKRYRDATQRLEEYRDEFFARYPAGRAQSPQPAEPSAGDSMDGPPETDPSVDIEDTTLIDLVEAFARIMQTVDFSRVGEHRVILDDTPVEIHAERILDMLRAEVSLGAPGVGAAAHGGSGGARGRMPFARLFHGRSRSEAIGLFLAILELVKQQRVLVRHESVGVDSEQRLERGAGEEFVLELAPEPAPLPSSAVPADEV